MEFSEERVFTLNAFFAVESCLVIRYPTPVGKETDDKGEVIWSRNFPLHMRVNK